MSVYAKENPDFLKESLDSVMAQTYLPDEIVLVCDGPLTDELYRIIEAYEKSNIEIMNVIKLPENKGTAHAANIGLEAARNEYIMKMDSDDICIPERAEKQMSYLAEYSDIGIIGAFIEEFANETGETIAIRKTPIDDQSIRKFARRRTPFNNQTLVYKKSDAQNIGGYCEDLIRCEDYDFMVRMLMSGVKAANLPEILLKYRVNTDNLNRRRNWNNTRDFIKVRKKIHKMGFSSFFDYLIPCTAQLILFITPTFVTNFIYKKLLRN